MVKVYKMILQTIGKILPVSYYPFGSIGKKTREICARNIAQKVGREVNIEKGAIICETLIIGDFSSVGVNCVVGDSVIIGKNVMMGQDCLLYTRNHKFDKYEKKYKGYTENKEIIIEDNVWIGARCIILGGVTIGEGSTIGAGSIVTKNIPKYSVAVGNPAKVIKNLI